MHGEIGHGWRYRAYVMAPLNAVEFSADEEHSRWTAEGQRGEHRPRRHDGTARVRRPSAVSRRRSASGTASRASNSGRASTFLCACSRPTRAGPAIVSSCAASTRKCTIDNADLLNQALSLGVGVDPNIARVSRGFYLEAGYRAIAASWGEIGVFTRYENVDTQFRMPPGYVPLSQFDRSSWTIGMTVLARSGHRGESGLHGAARSQPVSGAQHIRARAGMVVLMKTRLGGLRLGAWGAWPVAVGLCSSSTASLKPQASSRDASSLEPRASSQQARSRWS